MTRTTYPELTKSLRRAAVRATRAPSVHNTQPWRFVIRASQFEVHADRGRQLSILDPRARQLMLSCGCALFNARVALAASGFDPMVERLPDPSRPDLVAVLTPEPVGFDDDSELAAMARLDRAVEARQTNRRQFDEVAVPTELLGLFVAAAAAEGVRLLPIESDEDRLTVSTLSQLADRIENADPAYRAELRLWTTEDPLRVDGVPIGAVPHVDGTDRDDIPLRDFDTHGTGRLPVHDRNIQSQCLMLLGTDGDDRLSWLRAGEALERVLLEIARAGFTASPLTQVIEVPRTHEALRTNLGIGWHPHLLLRVGKAAPTPPTRRRRLVDVLLEA